MLLTSTRTRPTIVAAAAAVALLAAGCGSDGSDTTAGDGGGGSSSPAAVGVPNETGLIGVTEAEAEPQQGGTVTVGVFGEARTLDPATATASGALGGMEMAAIYGVLARYKPAAGEYEPWMAKSLKHSDDYGTWTLGLREGVEFTDGTPLNAAAVVAHMNRSKKGRNAALVAQIASMETPDDHTVVFHLKEPWSRFPYVLSVAPGMIASPTAVEKWGKEYGQHPVGAGPFVLDHRSPNEELVLTANENYRGEGPYLDKLRFVPISGPQAKFDSLEAGGIQAAYVRDASVILELRDADYGGYVAVINSGLALAINGSEGRPGADLRVRKALAYAINIEQFNQRAYEGKALAQKEIMAKGSVWATEAEATPYNAEKAKALLAEAKADGYDGELNILSSTSPTGQAVALALQAQFNAVGFATTIDSAPNISALYGRLIKKDYDLATFALSARNAAPWPDIVNRLKSGARTNRLDYSNPEMDALINQLHDATTEEGKQKALNAIQQEWTETVPMVPLAAIPAFIVWDDTVYGPVPTANSIVLFSQAWLSG